MQPSATAPRARMDDSFTNQSLEKMDALSTGNKTGKRLLWNTFDRTSKAAALHLETRKWLINHIQIIQYNLSTNGTGQSVLIKEMCPYMY